MKELDTILGDHIPIIGAPLPPEITINTEENTLLLKKFSLVKNCYFVCLGTIEPRKNQSLTVRGFLRFRQLLPDLSKKYKVSSHYKISTPTISYYEHNRYARIPKLINHLNTCNDIALVTDAGTPGISDPAYRLIRAAIDENCRVESIPGASALLTALVSSGLPTDRFIFEGFLPHR